MDNIDKYIFDIVNKKISEPKKFEVTIKNTLNNKKTLTHKIKKLIIIIFSIITAGGVVFAVPIVQKINLFIQKDNKYINSTDNNYIQYLNMEYETLDELSIKIDSILVDDFYMQLKIDYLYNQPITSAESKIIIKDENNNLILKINDSDEIIIIKCT